MKTVFIVGGTGYIGTRLTRALLSRGYRVIAFTRPGSERKVPPGAEVVAGNPFEAAQLAAAMPAGCTVVQLLGVAHPSPRKRAQFYQIDLPSVQATAAAAMQAGAGHFVYVSVAQEPTNIMKDYQAVRAEGEWCIRQTGLPYTFVRPWYVVGPGHWWPVLLWPLFKVLEWLPATRRKARALALVTIGQMLETLLVAVEQPRKVHSILDVDAIRRPEMRFKTTVEG